MAMLVTEQTRLPRKLSPKKRVTLNVSGVIFETYESTLSRFPNTLLGAENKRKHYYCPKTNEHFFNRNRLCFENILYFYQSYGSLNCPPGVQIPIFEEECKYFEIPDGSINRMKEREGIIFDLEDDELQCDEGRTIQMTIWNILENPNTSSAARVFGIVSLLMIWVCIITAFLETLPMYEKDPTFPLIELTLNIWFLIELVLRFICTKNRLEFAQGSMNWIDFFAVVPYFFLQIIHVNEAGLLGIFKTLKFIRVFRLFRLSKHSRRLKVVGIILKSSLGDFKLLMMCLLMVVFLGGTFMYFAEQNALHPEGLEFNSIPQGIWWSVQTLTSVGYGDIIPATVVGRSFAFCYMIFGVLTISLPVLTIVSQFSSIYPKNVENEIYQKSME